MNARRTEPTVGLLQGQKYRRAVDTDIAKTFARIKREQARAQAAAAQVELPGMAMVVVPLLRGSK